MAKVGEFLREELAIVSNGPNAAGVQEAARRVEPDPGIAADRAAPELDARQVAFPDCSQAHDEADFSRGTARLVRMRHDRRIKQGRGLERVFLSEIRSDQPPPRAAHVDLGAEPMGDEPEVVLQGLDQVAMPIGESGQRRGQRSFPLRLAQIKDAVDDSHRARPASDQRLLAGHEQPAERARGVWPQPMLRPCQQPARGAGGLHRGTVARRRPCCITEIIASVDSAPWLRLRPAGPRPSQPPPVCSSNMGTPASLIPRNHATPISTPASQLLLPVTVAARMHASDSAATSIGCWSKAGRTSPGPQPPAGTTDRWPSRVSVVTSHVSMRRPLRSTRARPSFQPATMTASPRAPFA